MTVETVLIALSWFVTFNLIAAWSVRADLKKRGDGRRGCAGVSPSPGGSDGAR